MTKKRVLFAVGGCFILLIYTVIVIVITTLVNKGSVTNNDNKQAVTNTVVASTSVPLDFTNINDTFDENKYEWGTPTSDNTETSIVTKFIQDGKYSWEVLAKKAVSSRSYLTVSAGANFTVSVDVKRIEGPNTTDEGIIFNKLDANNYYKFSVADAVKKYSLNVYSQGVSTKLVDWTASTAIKSGEVNNLKVVVVGSKISLYINGNKVTQVTNDTLSNNSGIGLIATVYDIGKTGKFEFDNLIYHLDEE